MKFNILDDLTIWQQTLLITLCAAICCWGFVNNTILLVFASKIGFPIGVAICAMSNNLRQILKILYYTIFLVLAGFVYFSFNAQYTINIELTKNFVPSWTDFVLALGVGGALSHFWNHPVRTNIIVLSAGVASLLPSCIMAGYHLSHNDLSASIASLELYFQYVIGLLVGAIIERKLIDNN
jgi:hypothetical protein